MKNIAVIVQKLCGGGAERMAANLTLELQKKYNVYFIVFDSTNMSYEYGGTLIDLKMPPDKESSAFRHVCRVIKRSIAVRKIKKKYKIDCTISHMEGANLVNIFSRRKDKVLSVFHSMPSQNLVKSKYNILIQKLIAKFSDKYIFVSKLAAWDVVDSFDVSAKNIMSIYNFCDNEKHVQQSKQEIPTEEAQNFYKSHKHIFVNMGRLLKLKGQEHLIKSFSLVQKAHPGAGLVILGNGMEYENLQRTVKKYHLEHDVFMPGNEKNPFPYLKHADVFVLSSLYEGLPMVLIEAAACGCPIISTDMPSGAREVLAPDTDILHVAKEKEYGRYGVLVPVCKEEAEEITEEERILADAMIEMLENQALRDTYMERSIECAERFSPECIMKQWVELIEA